MPNTELYDRMANIALIKNNRSFNLNPLSLNVIQAFEKLP